MEKNQSQTLSFYIKTIVLGLVVLAFAVTKQIQSSNSSSQQKLLVENSGFEADLKEE